MKYCLLFLSALLIISTVICQKQKVPQYLSIEVPSSDVNPQLQDFLSQSFQQILLKYPADSKNIMKDLKALQNVKPTSSWKNPGSIHTTVLYIGGDKSKLNTEIYKQFKTGQDVKLESTTFVYVPGKLICTPVFPEKVLIENDCPHMTLKVADWKPVQSNSVLEAIFTQSDYLKTEYESKFFSEPTNVMINKLTGILIDGEKVDVYVVKANKTNQKSLEFVGQTKNIY